MESSTIESPLAHLSGEEIEALGREFEAIHDEVKSCVRRYAR